MLDSSPRSASKHLFVSGPPRAGTTLLRLVLSAHPKITITPEARFIRKLFNKEFPPCERLNQEEMASIVNLMRSDVKLGEWPTFRLKAFIKESSSLPPLRVAEFLDRLFRSFALQVNSGIGYLGNKKDLYAEGFGPYTKRLFPDAKFIYIFRDPRDVSRSIVKNLEGRSLLDAAALCSYRRRYVKWMNRTYPADVLTVRYEDLVLKPEEICQGMCDFLGLAFDEQMVRFYETNEDYSLLIESTHDIHRHTTTPFNPDLIGQWKRSDLFSEGDLQMVESATRDYMREFGYETMTSLSNVRATAIYLRVQATFWFRHIKRRLKIKRRRVTRELTSGVR